MSELTAEQRAWVDALRSGKYKQAKRVLRTDTSFCCLGVACELAVANGVIEAPKTKRGFWRYEYEDKVLPAAVRNWLGLRTQRGTYSDFCLSEDNDNGATFDQIADTIERYASELFES